MAISLHYEHFCRERQSDDTGPRSPGGPPVDNETDFSGVCSRCAIDGLLCEVNSGELAIAGQKPCTICMATSQQACMFL